VDIMCPLASSVYTVSLPDRKRTLTAEELARTVRRQCPNVRAEESVEKAVEEALAEAGSEDVVLAFGSLSYLGQVKEAVERLGKKSRTELDKERGMRND
jgi:folylpolyglutamate synthase/dihydropteroate synthase